MERRRFLIVKRQVKGQPPLAGIFKGEQPLNSKPRPPAPIKNQQAISLRFFPGPCGSACVQHAEPSLAETKCTANKLLYRKISHCLVHSLLFHPFADNQNHRRSRWYAPRLQGDSAGCPTRALKSPPSAIISQAAAKAAFYCLFCLATRKRVNILFER